MRIKLPALLSLVALASAGFGHAGSFGGPPPFTNLSPLQSGIDGSYQAIARGDNLTGVIRFAYSNGVQTPNAAANSYVMFTQGDVVSGAVTAAINGKQIAGVLGGNDFRIPTDEQGNIQRPAVFVASGTRANGFFTGSVNLEDRLSFFSGKGSIAPAPETVETIVVIDQPQVAVGAVFDGVVVVEITIPGSSIEPNDFSFTGVRTSVIAQGSFQQPTN